MSIQAVSWALNDAPIRAAQLGVLLALADKAADDGRGAWPSRETIAYQTRKSVKQVTRDLKSLLDDGVIRLGDQRRTAYLPPDRRPVVYDLCMERRRDDPAPYREHPSGATKRSASDRGDTHVPPAVDNPPDRGDTHVPPVPDRGDIQGRPGGHTGSTGGTPTSPYPSLTHPEPSSPAQARSQDVSEPMYHGVVDGWMGAPDGGMDGTEGAGDARAAAEAVVDAIWAAHGVSGTRRPSGRLLRDVVTAAGRALAAGHTRQAVLEYVSSRGSLGGSDIRVPGRVLVTRLDALAAMPAAAPSPSTSERACLYGLGCRGGRLVCDNDACPDTCPGTHDPVGVACPDCTGTTRRREGAAATPVTTAVDAAMPARPRRSGSADTEIERARQLQALARLM